MAGCAVGFTEALSLLSYLGRQQNRPVNGGSQRETWSVKDERPVRACVHAWRQASLSDARRDDQLVALDHVLQLAQVAHVVDLPAKLEAAAQTQKTPPVYPSVHLSSGCS